MRRLASFILIGLMLLLFVMPVGVYADDHDYLLYYTYADLQMEKYSENQRYGTNSNHIAWQQLPTSDSARGVSGCRIIYLAKNEREGMQVYFYEKGEGRQLGISVGPFLNSEGVELPHEVFKEEYFLCTNVANVTLADALVPYTDGDTILTQNGQNETFYIEVRSAEDQPAGVYYADVTVYDGDTPLNTTRAAAIVWDFALPQQHYAKMITGLYNSSSGYGDSAYFLKQNGVTVDSYGNIAEEDRPFANAIIEGWQEYLLDHGVMTYELPRYMIDEDPKAAELAMADIRRQYFFVPIVNTYGGIYSAATLAKINQYKQLIGNNDYLVNKAYFYTMDEVNPITGADSINAKLAAANEAWPEVKKLITYNGLGGSYDTAMSVLDPSINVVCINTNIIVEGSGGKTAQEAFDDYNTNYAYKWRYHGNILYGSFELYRWGKSTIGMYRRMIFWQQQYMHEDAYLYWNCAYYANNWNIWENGASPAAGGAAQVNGNGYLLYPAAPIGLDPTVPIGSLRLKQINAGIEDADYLALCEEFMSEEDYKTMVKKLVPNAYGDTYWRVFNTEGIDTLPPWEVTSMNSARIAIGNALESVVSEHEWSDWQEIVEPDSTHCGLAVRHCLHCGTEESTEIPCSPNTGLIGDADLDGSVTFSDISAIYLHLVGEAELTEQGVINADFMQDGSVDYSDISSLYLFLISGRTN